MLSSSVIVSLFLSGLATGMVYALLAGGLTLIFGLLGVINFAHYAFIAVGAYIALEVLDAAGLNFWAALAISLIGVGLIGFLLERTLISRLYGQNPAISLIFTFGLAMAVVELLRMVKGTAFYHIAVPSALVGGVPMGDAAFPTYRIFLLVIGAVLFFGVWAFLQKTPTGLIIRAALCDRGMTRACGVGVTTAFAMTFSIGLALAGIGGALMAPMMGVFPEMGAEILIVCFAVIVIGGMGSFMGSLVAGLICGLLSSFITLVSPQMAMASIFIFMALILAVRPIGLFGEVGRVD